MSFYSKAVKITALLVVTIQFVLLTDSFSWSVSRSASDTSIGKRTPKYNDNRDPDPLAERRIPLLSLSHKSDKKDVRKTYHNRNSDQERFGCSAHFQRTAVSIYAAILSVVIWTSGGIPSQGESSGGALLSLARPQVCNALTTDQLLVDDVWREVGRQFFDPTFNGQGEEGWKMQRLRALEKAADFGPDDDAKLYAVIRGMLRSLNDPYTRFLTPEQFESLTKTYASNQSSSPKSIQQSTSGIGVQLIGDNKASVSQSSGSSGMVIVANTIASGPAETAGILPGDFIVSVDGVDMTGATAETVAARCRGESGTTVNIEIERPPIEEGTEPKSSSKRRTLTVTRTQLPQVAMIEVSTAMIPTTNEYVGIVKINSFTQETEQAVRRELKQLIFAREEGGSSNSQEKATADPQQPVVSAIAIDLRGNVGGYMPAGVDVAKMFLPPKARIISEVDKTGRAKIYINDGIGSETDTTTPLYILVDEKTASASEILTAALQDNKRAVVVAGGGADKTFGKGRIQNVQALSYGGSGIAITKAKYTTPNGRDIHGVGISPDLRSRTCSPKDSAAVCLESIL
mmetsp:Transcript_11283/g.27097  ORF Transcript_11283/g.27097 Transcript_11283/m.27097 type:complete len:572 (+) Transcript_11283:197-1912(+)